MTATQTATRQRHNANTYGTLKLVGAAKAEIAHQKKKKSARSVGPSTSLSLILVIPTDALPPKFILKEELIFHKKRSNPPKVDPLPFCFIDSNSY